MSRYGIMHEITFFTYRKLYRISRVSGFIRMEAGTIKSYEIFPQKQNKFDKAGGIFTLFTKLNFSKLKMFATLGFEFASGLFADFAKQNFLRESQAFNVI